MKSENFMSERAMCRKIAEYYSFLRRERGKREYEVAERMAHSAYDDAIRELQRTFGIEEFPEEELSARAINGLMRSGIWSLRKLTQCSAEELLTTKNFGQKSLNEVRQYLLNRDLGLKGEFGHKEFIGCYLHP